MEEGGIVPPHSVLAPRTALGLLPSRSPILRLGQRHCSGQKNNVSPERRHDEPRVGRLFDLSCHARNLRSLPVGPTRVGPWMRRHRPAMVEAGPHDALDGVALPARNSHQINPHLPYRYQAELLTVIVSGTSRRNVLGAIANGKERLQLPVATTTELSSKEQKRRRFCRSDSQQ